MKIYFWITIILRCLCNINTLLAQPPVYKNLVLEGGGIRGIAYGGALAELEQRNILQQIKRVGGTSAGAIQAALLAVGYMPHEITDITFRTPVQQFSDGRLFFLGGFPRLIHQYGWYRGEKFQKWIEQLISRKTGNPHLTFAQLHALAGEPNMRDLYVMGTNLTQQKAVVFSHETYPDMKISDAVRISMSIPLYFRAVFVDQKGTVVKKPGRRTDLEVLVDGGILANYPIDLFDHAVYLMSTSVPTAAGNIFNTETLGIRLDSDTQIQYDQQQAGLAPFQIINFNEYLGAFYAIIIEQLNRQHLQPADWDRTISVSTKGYGARIRRLNEKDKAILLASGRQGVLNFFDKQARRP
jgi:NTE family protein